MEPIFFTTSLELGDERTRGRIPFLEDDEGRNSLTFHFVEPSDDRRLGDFRMIDSALSTSVVPMRWPRR